MATWSDIERNLDRLEDLDEATLLEFARVMPPLSDNPNFHRRFDQAQQRIQRRLDQFAAQRHSQYSGQDRSDNKWYKKPVGILILTVTGGLLLALLKYVFGI